jgi:ATP-dependent protease ClpP protease subunit
MNDGEDDSTKIISIDKQNQDNCISGNKIYFYQDVTRESILNLNRQIDEISKQVKIIQFTFNLSEPPPIEIHICSDGGEIYAGMAAADKIINNTIPIHTYCEGIVASSATLLSVVGHKRFITKNSHMLLHQISGNFWGNFMQLKDETLNFELIMKTIKTVYLKKTKFKENKLNELLKHDLCLDSETCLNYGLVNSII